MSSLWDRVDAWRSELRGMEPDVGLSPEGTRIALARSLDALDAVPRHLDRPAPPHTVLVCASTVFTAPLEWAAVLLARGGRVTLKAPRALERWFGAVADATDLPLQSTTDRAVLEEADTIVAMGSDETLDAIRATLRPDQRLLGFGHRFSVAWWDDPADADALALDLALYDGRGCMSPVAVFSPLPDAVDRLALAMMAAEDRIPRGALRPGEGAAIRTRTALARATGTARVGSAWAVCGLPLDRFDPRGLPRTAVVHGTDARGFLGTVLPWADRLSTIGARIPDAGPDGPTGFALGVARVCAPGEMQSPPLDRLHDGIDWLRTL